MRDLATKRTTMIGALGQVFPDRLTNRTTIKVDPLAATHRFAAMR